MRIDYVFVGPGPEIVRAVLLGTQPDADGFYASDHFGVAATLRWPAGQAAARRSSTPQRSEPWSKPEAA
jgi:hypothetical protein